MAGSRKTIIPTALKVGKYLVTSLTRPIDDGRFAAIVSIRSGTGSMTHDLVVRFAPVFETHDRATSFATEQALAWIDRPARATHRATSLQV
jgi:hypothetical protein